MSQITIYHNPACGTSRNTLAMIRNAGIEPVIVEYIHTPPSREKLVELIAAAGLTPQTLLRKKGTVYEGLRPDDPALGDDALLDTMVKHPILINRPLVETPSGGRLCRPSEIVLEILPTAQQGAFTREDGEQVVDEQGQRI